jgi:hypothetical protein
MRTVGGGREIWNYEDEDENVECLSGQHLAAPS